MCVGLIGSACVKKNAVNKITFNKRFNKNFFIKPMICCAHVVDAENSLVHRNLIERDNSIKQIYKKMMKI